MVEYRYELRRGDEVVATGHLSREQPFEVGERVTIGGHAGTVRRVEPTLSGRELRLVVQLAERAEAEGPARARSLMARSTGSRWWKHCGSSVSSVRKGDFPDFSDAVECRGRVLLVRAGVRFRGFGVVVRCVVRGRGVGGVLWLFG